MNSEPHKVATEGKILLLIWSHPELPFFREYFLQILICIQQPYTDILGTIDYATWHKTAK